MCNSESDVKSMSSNWIHNGLRPALLSNHCQAHNLSYVVVLCQVGKRHLRQISEKLKEDLVETAVSVT